MSKFDVGWGFTPDPTGGVHSAPPDPIAAFKGRKGGKGRVDGREGEMREREGVEGEEERKGGRKDEQRPPTLKCRKIHSFSLFFSVIKSSQEAR